MYLWSTERKRKRVGTNRPLEERGMPGPGTGEWDGGWSMFTLLLPNKYIPTTESWRLFNLQITKLQQFPTGEFPHCAIIYKYSFIL